MAKSRVSAAVCLLRGSWAECECFLVRRNPKLRFLGGFWAFPGGTLEEEDGGDLAVTARRELFEECGVLAGPDAARDRESLHELRLHLLGTNESARAGARRTLSASFGDSGLPLRSIARIETPPIVPRRYDTVFELAWCPDGAEASVVPGELVDGEWLRPEAALAAWTRGEMWIAPPVRFLLEELARAPDEDSFVRAATTRAEGFAAGELHPVWFVPGVFLAPLRTDTIPPATATNCYVVGRERLFVVDPASPDEEEQARLFAFLDQQLAAGARLDAVLLTHGHPDHTGAVAACCDRYGVPVVAHPKTLPQVPGNVTSRRELVGGERLPLGRAPDGSPDWRLEVHATPGHHPGHLCFVESRYRSILLGDLVSTLSTIVIDPPEGHLATYLDSLRRMHELELGMGFPAHGPPAREACAALAGYLEHRQAREDELWAALGRGAREEAALLPEVYADVAEAMWPLAARSLAAGLEKLQEEGRVRLDRGLWSRMPGA